MQCCRAGLREDREDLFLSFITVMLTLEEREPEPVVLKSVDKLMMY